jgi:hypothetical protein
MRAMDPPHDAMVGIGTMKTKANGSEGWVEAFRGKF